MTRLCFEQQYQYDVISKQTPIFYYINFIHLFFPSSFFLKSPTVFISSVSSSENFTSNSFSISSKSTNMLNESHSGIESGPELSEIFSVGMFITLEIISNSVFVIYDITKCSGFLNWSFVSKIQKSPSFLNPKSAKKLLNIINPINNYLDIQMNRYYNQLNVYYVIPTLVKHNFKIPSTRNSGKGNGYIYTKQFTEASKKITIV